MSSRRRWPRAVMATLVAAGSAALGTIMAVTAPAGATTGLTCGLKCPAPTGTIVGVGPTAADGTPGAIKTTWTGVADDAKLSAVQVTVTWTPIKFPKGAPAPKQQTDVVTATCATQADGTVECNAPWPPTIENNGFVLNGTYSVSATTTSCSVLVSLLCSDVSTAANPNVTVVNPPTAPTKVTATLATAPASGVVIGWSASPEPDIFLYQVIRRSALEQPVVYACAQPYAPAEFKSLPVCPKVLSATDPAPGGGQFTYDVIATRVGATYAIGVPSKAATSKPVTVAGPPAATGGGVPIPGGHGLTFGNIVNPVKPGTGFGSVVAPKFPTVAPSGPPTTDTGFNPTLPYGQQPTAPTDPPTVAAAAPASKGGHSSVGSIALVGAGLLVIVVALHGLWLRSEVRRSGPLEALEPEM